MNPTKRQQRATSKAKTGRGRHAKPAEPRAEVPPELRPTDYEFQRVALPEQRPHPTVEQLRAALDDEQPTQRLPRVGVVVDQAPAPAQHEGLAPAPGPHIPEPVPVPVPTSQFLNAGATPEPPLPAPTRGQHRPGLVFSTFDGAFWHTVITHKRRAQAVADVLEADNERTAVEMTARLDAIERMLRGEPPLPHRVPGAALAAIEADRRELAVAR
ncbi:MAG: hypothetical protein ACRDVE_04385 [Actinocrinis sp.]